MALTSLSLQRFIGDETDLRHLSSARVVVMAARSSARAAIGWI